MRFLTLTEEATLLDALQSRIASLEEERINDAAQGLDTSYLDEKINEVQALDCLIADASAISIHPWPTASKTGNASVAS